MFANGYSLKIEDKTPESAVFCLRVLKNYADSIDVDPYVDLEISYKLLFEISYKLPLLFEFEKRANHKRHVGNIKLARRTWVGNT